MIEGRPVAYLGPALVATLLAAHGWRKGSLSASGAAAAWVSGFLHLAAPLKVFAATLLVFYFAGSKATKVKTNVKAILEDGPDPSKPGGNRNWIQVLSNSFPGIIVALLYRYNYPDGTPSQFDGLPNRLMYALLGHYATCLADTLASELGILAKQRPRHILTWRQVPAGTNGGVTTLGIAMSAIGGTVMGVAVALCLLLEAPSTCALPVFLRIVFFGKLAGLAGSLLDSLLGATLQRTLYSSKDGRVLTDHSTAERTRASGVITIGPGLNVLSNSAVNAISGSAMAVAGYIVGGW